MNKKCVRRFRDFALERPWCDAVSTSREDNVWDCLGESRGPLGRFKTSDHEEPPGGATKQPGYINCEPQRIVGLVVFALFKLRKLHYPECRCGPAVPALDLKCPLGCER